MADITIHRSGVILIANTRLGRLVLDECFFATQSCCVDDDQYWFTDSTEFPIVEKVLSDFGIKYTFPNPK